MRKFLLLIALVWRVSVYSGDTGRIIFTAVKEPIFIHGGRWLYFVDDEGEEITVSGSSTIIIRKCNEGK